MKTVFVVDDSETNLMTAKQALEGHYKTFAMTFAARMFKLLNKVTPNLILLDIDMPEMNGLEAMDKLRADPKTAGIPIILITSHSDKETVARGLALEAEDYIVKPFAPHVLLDRIQKHIN